jgi:hypothetical protein
LSKIATSLTQKGITPILQIRVIPHNSSEGGSMNYESEFEIFAAQVRSLEKTIGSDMASELFQVIGAGRAIVDGLKTLATYADEVKDISKRGEFMRIIGELSLNLAETQIKLSDRIREIDELKEQASNLQKEIENLKDPKTKLILKLGLYYSESGDGPFCTGCSDNNQKRIRVNELSGSFKALGKYKCPVCEAKYLGK